MTQEQKVQLETRVWKLSQAISAIEGEISDLREGEYSTAPEVIFEAGELEDLALKLHVVRNDVEARAKFTDEEEIDNLFGPAPTLALVPTVDPFPYMAPDPTDLASIDHTDPWNRAEELSF